MKQLILIFAVSIFALSCNGEKKKRGADYNKLKTELNLQGEKAANFESITKKYDAQRKSARESMGENVDRVALFTKFEEIQKQQDGEISQVLNEQEMIKYHDFVAKNTRKKPRYNNELLAKINSELQLDEKQMNVVNAANNAFEKAFSDAHDVYHGNTELAKEYWTKFDVQRKEAISKVLTAEQNSKFLEIVKDQQFKGRE